MKAALVFCEGYHDVVFAQRSLGAHGDCEWVDKPIGGLPSPFGSAGRVARKGLIATRFERQAIDNLTLEDHLAPMAASAWPERYAGAERFVDDNRDAGDKVSTREAERLKAIITVTGQFDNPGDPLSIGNPLDRRLRRRAGGSLCRRTPAPCPCPR